MVQIGKIQPATTTDSTNPFAQFSSAGPTATSQAQPQQPQIPLAALYQNQGVMGIPGYGMTAQQMMYPQMGGQVDNWIFEAKNGKW